VADIIQAAKKEGIGLLRKKSHDWRIVWLSGLKLLLRPGMGTRDGSILFIYFALAFVSSSSHATRLSSTSLALLQEMAAVRV
jgi:hypothetical protein